MEETMTAATAQSEARSSTIKLADRRAHGKRLRDTAPRDAHAENKSTPPPFAIVWRGDGR